MLEVTRISMNSRLEVRLQPLHERSSKFLWIRAFAALPVPNELTEAFGNRWRRRTKVVEVLGDEYSRMSCVLRAILSSTMEQRKMMLRPDAVAHKVIDVIPTRLTPRPVEPRLLVLEPRITVVGIEVQDFRHLHGIDQTLPTICRSMPY